MRVQGASSRSVWVYMSTPLGPGLAQIREDTVAHSKDVRIFAHLYISCGRNVCALA
jgi:hypothetical protein